MAARCPECGNPTDFYGMPCEVCGDAELPAPKKRAYPGGTVGGVPAFNKANADHVEQSNRRSPHAQRNE